MLELGIKTERNTSQYRAWFHNLPGVSIIGYGHTEDKAKLDLLFKLLKTSKSHMNKVLSRLGVKTDSLDDVTVSYQFCEDGKLLLHLSNSLGETRIEEARWRKED